MKKISPLKSSPLKNSPSRKYSAIQKQRQAFKRTQRCVVCKRVPYFNTPEEVKKAISDYKSQGKWNHIPELLQTSDKSAISYLKLTEEMLEYPNIIISFEHNKNSFIFQNVTLERCGNPPLFNFSRNLMGKNTRRILEKNFIERSKMNVCIESQDNPDMCCAICYDHAKIAIARNVALYHHKLIQQLFKIALKQTYKSLNIDDEIIKEAELLEKVLSTLDK